MEDTYNYKEVFFDRYCGTCRYEKMLETDDPCDECLINPVNLYSHKPINWKEKDKKRGKSNGDSKESK